MNAINILSNLTSYWSVGPMGKHGIYISRVQGCLDWPNFFRETKGACSIQKRHRIFFSNNEFPPPPEKRPRIVSNGVCYNI